MLRCNRFNLLVASLALMLSTIALSDSKLDAQDRQDHWAAGGDSKKIEGELKFAKDSNKESESPQYVVVNGDKKWHLVIEDAKVASMMKRGVGQNVQVDGVHSTRKLDDGTTRIEVRVESMVSRRKIDAKTAKAIEKRNLAARKRYQASQVPLTKEEKTEVIAEFGKQSKILDANFKLKQELKISLFRNTQTDWTVQPDGSFEKFRFLPHFDRDGRKLVKTSAGKGKLSERQLVELAKLIKNRKLLELPDQIGEEIEIDERFGRAKREVIVMSFGDFKCTGGRAYRDSDEAKEVQERQRRLTAVMFGFVMQAQRNLQFQDAKNKEDKQKD